MRSYFSIFLLILALVFSACSGTSGGEEGSAPVMPDEGLNPSFNKVPDTDNTYVLNWTEISDAVSYSLEYSVSQDSGYVPVSSLTDGSLTFSGLNSGETYYFRIRAQNSHGYSQYCEPFSFEIPVPAKPDYISSVSWNKLVGSWELTNSNNPQTASPMLRFRKDYRLAFCAPNADLYYIRSLRLINNNTIRGYWAGVAETGFDWQYTLSDSDTVLTITYGLEGYELTHTYEKSDSLAFGVSVYFDPVADTELPYAPPGGLRNSTNQTVFFFDSDVDRSSLTPQFDLPEGSVLSPIPSAGDLDQGMSYTFTRDNGSSVLSGTIDLIGETRPTDNLLVNGDFTFGAENWYYFVTDDPAVRGTGLWSSGNGTWDNGHYVLDVTTKAQNPGGTWCCTFRYNLDRPEDFMTLENGKNYTLTFDAYSSVDRTIILKIGEEGRDLNNDDNDYSSYLPDDGTNVINLTTTPQTYTVTFTMNNPTDNKPTLQFECGTEASKVYFDNIKLVEAE